MKYFNKEETRQKRKLLRKKQTDAERTLWAKLRNKQVLGCKFFRQYGIGTFIADFYCPEIKIVIEVDGGQHFNDEGMLYDAERSKYMESIGIKTIRFSNVEVLCDLETVMSVVYEAIHEVLIAG